MPDKRRRKKIFLVYPPSDLTSDSIRFKGLTPGLFESKFPPNDLLNLAAIAEHCGVEPKIKDYSYGGDVIADIKEFMPDYLLMEVTVSTFKADMELLAVAKAINPNLIIIVKGVFFLAHNVNIIYENPFIDYIIIGEPELTLKEILEGFPENDIKGICYKENFQGINLQGIKNEPRDFNENLENLPLPARHFINNLEYRSLITGRPQAFIEVSRGCPNQCFFCLATSISGPKIRWRTFEHILLEIKECINKYNIRDFVFGSDILNFDKDNFAKLCKKIIDANLKITWSANITIDNIDEEIVELMYTSGCRLVGLGIESGSQEILNNIGKNNSLEKIEQVVRLLKKYKIKVLNYFMLGFPWDTEETINETIEYALKLDSDFINFNVATPLPGSKFFAYAMLSNLIQQPSKNGLKLDTPIINTHSLSRERVLELRDIALRKYYFRLNMGFRILKTSKSFYQLNNNFKLYLNLLKCFITTKKDKVR